MNITRAAEASTHAVSPVSMIGTEPLLPSTRGLYGEGGAQARIVVFRSGYECVEALDGEHLVDLERAAARHVRVRLEHGRRRIRVVGLDDRVPPDVHRSLGATGRDLAHHLERRTRIDDRIAGL